MIGALGAFADRVEVQFIEKRLRFRKYRADRQWSPEPCGQSLACRLGSGSFSRHRKGLVGRLFGPEAIELIDIKIG